MANTARPSYRNPARWVASLRRRSHRGAVVVVLAVGALQAGTALIGQEAVPWNISPENPVIGMYRAPLALKDRRPGVWNDPSVLAEEGSYSMWASLGYDGPSKVAIYKLQSSDGETWEVVNGSRPVLEHGGSNDFDRLGVETPAVVKAGDTYHMYYSAYRNGQTTLVTMGHATSKDGVRWTKLGELKSLTGSVGQKGNPWGRLARGEPSVMYHDGVFYLYFTDVRCRRNDCSGSPASVRGISLATSLDGHNFRQFGTEPILQQTASYPASDGWEGYSTPAIVEYNGVFELFCSVFRIAGGKSIQTALSQFHSDDAVNFTEVEASALVAGRELWADASIRSPSVIAADGVWRMWYAGDNYDPARQRPTRGAMNAGIGLAVRQDASMEPQ